jgi:ubiquinone/menaquinone biosynthesis C-methylase UbiE
LQEVLRTSNKIKYISGDLNSLMNCDIKLDITNMNFEGSFFDVIICNYVLNHIGDDRKAMSGLLETLSISDRLI